LFGAANATEFNNGTPQPPHFGTINIISISLTTYLNATSLEGHEKLDVCPPYSIRPYILKLILLEQDTSSSDITLNKDRRGTL
jgi:hypothetical protein